MPRSLPADFITPADAVTLPLDVVAVQLLRYGAHLEDQADSAGAGDFTREYVQLVSAWGDTLADVDERTFLKVMNEVWDWLYVHGLISGPWRQHRQDAFVTQRGRQLLADGDDGLARLRAERRLDVDLHPRMADQVRTQLVVGQPELAAFAAMRAVEIRVRELAGAPESLVGVKLMQEAFRPGGALFDEELDAGESEQLMALFRGAIGVFKNPPSHRQVEYDDSIIGNEIVLLADLLLRMLDGIEERLNTIR